MQDDKLELLLNKIKTSNNSNNKLIYYKQAINRLDKLKIKYNNLADLLKKPVPTKPTEKICIEKIVLELENINESIESDSADMADIIKKYIKYKMLINDLDTQVEQFSNEISKVNACQGKIVVTKIELNDIL